MAKVIINQELKEEIFKIFKKDSRKVLTLLGSLESSPKKGKIVGQIKGIIIKEVKYEGYRFYCICDGYKIKFLKIEELTDIIIRFVRMSNKKNQQKIIDEIKEFLRNINY